MRVFLNVSFLVFYLAWFLTSQVAFTASLRSLVHHLISTSLPAFYPLVVSHHYSLQYTIIGVNYFRTSWFWFWYWFWIWVWFWMAFLWWFSVILVLFSSSPTCLYIYWKPVTGTQLLRDEKIGYHASILSLWHNCRFRWQPMTALSSLTLSLFIWPKQNSHISLTNLSPPYFLVFTLS